MTSNKNVSLFGSNFLRVLAHNIEAAGHPKLVVDVDDGILSSIVHREIVQLLQIETDSADARREAS